MATDKNDSLGGFGADVFKSVREMPTAYDIDKVVEELESHRNEITCDVDIDNAIEIVKRGGVDDDVCEWKKQNKTYDWQPSCEPNSTYNVAGVGWFKYCPYCSKKIKVVE